MARRRSDDEQWEAWGRDFDTVVQQMHTQFHTRWVWRTLIEMLRYSEITQYATMQNYLVSTYVATICTGIRRECDLDTRTASLVRCLQMLVDRPEIASREWFTRSIEGFVEDEDLRPGVSASFDTFAPAGLAHVEPRLITADIGALRSIADPVREYVNKVLAHRERAIGGQPLAIELTFDDMNAALDEVGRITRRYYSLRHPGMTLAGMTMPRRTGLVASLHRLGRVALLHACRSARVAR